jgi:hypothetical protein
MNNEEAEINVNYIVQAFQDRVSQLTSELVVKEAMLKQLKEQMASQISLGGESE